MQSEGIGFFGLLTIVFITLKLMGYITWSWIWVTFFLWFPLAIVAFGMVVYVICWLISLILSKKKRR